MVEINKTTKLRMRRLLRRKQRQMEAASVRADEQFEIDVMRRLASLRKVKRFVFGWVSLVIILIVTGIVQTVQLSNAYQQVGPVDGGIFNEGMVGSFSNANPVFASGAVDTSISRLLFAGLFRYDAENKLTGDLAQDYTVDELGKLYTVHLRPNLTWHDGRPLTAADVAFTYHLIQNPDTRSPLLSSWQGIEVTEVDPLTVTFRLPSTLSSFPYSLTNGIVPEHKLASLKPEQIRASSFNTSDPIGSGPFSWSAIQIGSAVDAGSASALIALKAFDAYHDGRPAIDEFVIRTYNSADQLIAAYQRRNVEAMAGLQDIPADISADPSTHLYNFRTTAAKMVFFKTSGGLLADSNVRRALARATDRTEIMEELGLNVRPIWEPILPGQIGYDKAYQQDPFNLAEANAILDKAGWARGSDGIRVKDRQRLQFSMLADESDANRTTGNALSRTWRQIGVDMKPSLLPAADFRALLETHEYTALLYGISIGPDPDVFAYWNSTQADVRSSNRLNFSEYSSAVADTALEAGRTRQDVEARSRKYHAFLKAWKEDTPAVALYQQADTYISRGAIYGLEPHVINTDADRYYSVASWKIKTARVNK